MANFALPNSTAIGGGGVNQAISATYKTQVVVANSTIGSGGNAYVAGPRRGKLYDILIGSIATPADNYYEWDACRCTYGASTAFTTGTVGMVSSLSSNFVLDQGDGNMANYASINSSVETYLTANGEQWYVGINQRASYRWVAAPGSEIVWPANTSAGVNGVCLRARSSAGTGSVSATIMFQEQ